MNRPSAYVDGLRLLGRREMSVAQLKARLLDREHGREDVEAAIERLVETRALDDRRVASAYARTALKIKGRGRLRIQRELQTMGIPKDIAAAAIAETFGEVDERGLITKSIQKKLRMRGKIETQADYARVYQYLMRQGFSAAAVSAALRAYRKEPDNW